MKEAQDFTDAMISDFKVQKKPISSILNRGSPMKQMTQEVTGNIMDLQSPMHSRKQSVSPHKFGQTIESKLKKGSEPEQAEFASSFIPDVDNFLGVKNISNYFITCLRDECPVQGKMSVGVLQLYNKCED